MSEQINNGGPVFPTPAGVQHNDGMTLRDYFAAAALQGNIAHPDVTGNRDDIAKDAYKYADAMLRAKEDKP